MRGFWRGKRVVITAGPTREALDPVRYLSNASSGRMGWALARAARRQGARVTLIAGPTALARPAGVRWVPVVSARDMHQAALRHGRSSDAFIGAAAVADWRPAVLRRSKLKKSGAPPRLRLVTNPDILKSIADGRRGGRPRVAGFALETTALLRSARQKMSDKKLDLIVANPTRVIGGDRTEAWILTPGASPVRVRGSKDAVARRVLTSLAGIP